jgi:TPR repeat protein
MNGYKNLTKESLDYVNVDNGEAEGFNNLGWLYKNGLGVKRNLAKASELY